MKILPAIDVKGGRCVRLRQGRAEDETAYGDDPVAMALHWQAEGAGFLHVVDLDGAFGGWPTASGLCKALASALSIPFEIGGGLRTDDDVAAALDAGASRVVLGSRAVSDPAAAAALAAKFGPERIVAGIDARDGFAQVSGWTETTRVRALDLARELAGGGFRVFAFTDTATDGMLSGPNLSAMEAMARAIEPFGARLVASGGVRAPSDVAALRALARPNLDGVIVGKALYEKAASLAAFDAAAAGPLPEGTAT